MTKSQQYAIQIDADDMKIIIDALESYHVTSLKIYEVEKRDRPTEDYTKYWKEQTEKEMLLIEKWNHLRGKILDETDWLPF